MRRQEHPSFMSTSSSVVAHRAIVIVLLVANSLLYTAWPWLRGVPLDSYSLDTADIRNVVRSELGLAWFFDSIHAERKILFLGTSESTSPYNLARQLNRKAPDHPGLVAISRAGMSPIHSTLVMAKSKREGISIPPIMLIINPVYFTEAYDAINDGWLSKVVHSPVFLQMDHRNISNYLSEEVRRLYERHFALKRILYPAMMQEYLGNLLYLRFHQIFANVTHPASLPVRTFQFDGVLPQYDEERSVWTGYKAADQFAKGRWEVKPPEESVNLKGLASTMTILRDEPAPVLLLVLPVNRTFYKHNGLDMAVFDQRYRAIRNEIREMAYSDNIYLIDLFDLPKLHLGFKDRFHNDQYGFFQLADYILKSKEHKRFIDAVQSYYSTPTPHHEIVVMQPSSCLTLNCA